MKSTLKGQSLELGIEVFLESKLFQKYQGSPCALLTNQSACLRNFYPSYFALKEALGEGLRFLFSPQHGLFADKQANMIGSEDEVEPFFGLRVISLYGPRLKPDVDLLSDLEVVFVDLPEVGCRVYTYIWTTYLLLSACEKARIKVVVLDRPNPLGGAIEGPVLEREYFSFVGLDHLPMRHGLTLGELVLLFKKRYFKSLEVEVVPCEGVKRSMIWPELGLAWLNPSPNLPDFYSALCYPGLVLLEGTNLSEGRGTTKPFTTFGAPYLRIKNLYADLKDTFPADEWGIIFRPLAFEPTFDKWKGERCYGFELRIVDPHRFRPVEFALKLLKLLKLTHEDFEFLPPPYEFEYKKPPIEILIGSKELLNWLYFGNDLEVPSYLSYNLNTYQEDTSTILLYER